MGSFPSALVSRLAAFVALGLFATATITFAAEQKLTASQPSATTPTATAPDVIVVPDVRGQAYVFAEGMLEDAGFGWSVSSRNGFAANLVVGQSPLPGTHVVDTGAPLVTLTLQKSPSYAQRGTPVNTSPFAATAIRLADAAAARTQAPATTTTAAPTPAPAAAPKPAPAAKQPTAVRKPDFVVPGAPKEPQKELPLPDRARLLGTWLSSHRTKSKANVSHWLYQHQWIVTGAKFGWWHGDEALKTLIQDDRRAQALWGIGAQSEAVARAALAELETRSS